MGTSTARRAPGRRSWRRLKRLMGRFAAEGAPVQKAAEVVACYWRVMAQEPLQVTAGRWQAIARTAAQLLAFYQTWIARGWSRAVASLGLRTTGLGDRRHLWLELATRLAGSGATLAQAVARAALVDHLTASLPKEPAPDGDPQPPAAAGLSERLADYMGRALALGLEADLGEILEYRAPSPNLAWQGYQALRREVHAQLAAALAEMPAENLSASQLLTALAAVIGKLAHESGRP